MNTFFFTSSLCNTQFKQNLTHPESSADKLISFLGSLSTGCFYPPFPVSHQQCFLQMLFQETGMGSSSWLGGRSSVEQRGQSSTGTRGSPRDTKGNWPSMANSRWGQTQSTSMVVSVKQLHCEASCASWQAGKGTHFNSSKRGKQCQRNFSYPQTLPPFPYRLPSDPKLWRGSTVLQHSPDHQCCVCRSQASTQGRGEQNQLGTYCHRVLHGGVHFCVPQVDVSPADSPQ